MGTLQELKPLRVFIAIALPEEIRRRIAEFQRGWQSGLRACFIRWTPAAQIHLTLRFIGTVPAHEVPELEAAMRRACAGVSEFDLEAGGRGCFPDGRNPRVLWIDVGGDLESLTWLQGRVQEETQGWGEIETRAFRAHFTVGRVKDAPPSARREIALRAQSWTCGELGRWRVREVLLMRSELAPAGATHTELARIPLVG